MKMIKTSELIGAALDWVVAKCEIGKPIESFLDDVVPHPSYNNFRPSTNWSQGGPIIEREKIDVQYDKDRVFDPDEKIERWFASKPFEVIPDAYWVEYGPTPLIAAMRCYVASKLGDEVEIPEELL